MGDFLRIPHQHCRHIRVDIKHQLQLVFRALYCGGGHHIHQHRGNHILLLGRRKGSLRDLGIIQDITDVVGEPLPRQLDRLDILPNLWGDILFQDNLTDTHYHIDGGTEFVGNIGEEHHILPPRRFQLLQHTGIPLLFRQPAVDTVSCNTHTAKDHHTAQHQAHHLLGLHIGDNGVQDEAVVEEHGDI